MKSIYINFNDNNSKERICLIELYFGRALNYEKFVTNRSLMLCLKDVNKSIKLRNHSIYCKVFLSKIQIQIKYKYLNEKKVIIELKEKTKIKIKTKQFLPFI